MSIIPFGIAWYLAKHPGAVKLGTNNGDLISPPQTTNPEDLVGYDDFSAENIKELQGHWVLVNLLPEQQCSESCQEGLFKTQQIALMMGKDIARIRRLAVIMSSSKTPLTQQWQDDLRLLKAKPSEKLVSLLNQLTANKAVGGLLLMDPLGNLMMHYPPGYDPYQVRNDLSKLLRISQIG